MSERRIEDILESITDEFFAVESEWRFTYINERALRSIQKLKGDQELTREEVLGKNQWEVVPEVVGSVFYQKYHEAMREQKAVEFEAYSPFSERWGEVHAYPSEEGLSVYAHDITERKRAEEYLRYHASLLENTEDAVLASDEHAVLGALNATITGNTIAQPGTLAMNGLHLNSGTNGGDDYQVCLDIGDPAVAAERNTVTGSGALGGTDYRLRQRMNTTVRLPGYTGPATDPSGTLDGPLTTYLTPRTNGAFTLSSTTVATGGGFLNTAGAAACAQP
jgi:PAS domain S-box-containing protein